MSVQFLKSVLAPNFNGGRAYTYVASILFVIGIVAVANAELPTGVVGGIFDAVRWDSPAQIAREVEAWSEGLPLPLRHCIGMAALSGIGIGMVGTFVYGEQTRAASTAWFAFVIATQYRYATAALLTAGLFLVVLLLVRAVLVMVPASGAEHEPRKYQYSLCYTVNILLFGWMLPLVPVGAFFFGRISRVGDRSATVSAARTTENLPGGGHHRSHKRV